jgi:hypothetical protein
MNDAALERVSKRRNIAEAAKDYSKANIKNRLNLSTLPQSNYFPDEEAKSDLRLVGLKVRSKWLTAIQVHFPE